MKTRSVVSFSDWTI